MLVPQSLAYALLAGLPPQAGLMASLLPVLAYAVFGSSASLSVGPAAITSLMVYQALTPLAPGTASYAALSVWLAMGSALLMLGMGWLRMGFLSQLLSRPVVQGFTVASALLILLGQLAPTGVARHGAEPARHAAHRVRACGSVSTRFAALAFESGICGWLGCAVAVVGGASLDRGACASTAVANSAVKRPPVCGPWVMLVFASWLGTC